MAVRFVYYGVISSRPIPIFLILSALALLALVTFAAFFPHPWLWGVNWWSGLDSVRVVSGIIAVSIVSTLSYVLLRWAEKGEKREARSEKREARSEKREARSEKREARSEKREARSEKRAR